MSGLCSALQRGGRVPGNREVSRCFLLLTSAEFGAREKASHKEGEAEGKHGFPSGSEPQASDAGERDA
jgi:hypothetical protein